MPHRILRRPAVEHMTGLSRSTLYAMMDPRSPYHDPAFPRPVQLGRRAVGWPEQAVVDWLESRATNDAV